MAEELPFSAISSTQQIRDKLMHPCKVHKLINKLQTYKTFKYSCFQKFGQWEEVT